MSDERIRTLWRRAGEGDLLAARCLVTELEREQGVAPDGTPSFLPPLSTGSRDADEVITAIDALVQGATAGLEEPWLASPTRLWPRPGLPGGRLIGVALDAALMSSSTPGVGWTWEPHYRQVLCLAVNVDGAMTLGVSVARGEWSLRPSGHWPDEIHQWSVRPRPHGAAPNFELLSAPLALRLAAWARVNGPAARLTRVRFSLDVARAIRDALGGRWSDARREFPDHDHRCHMAIFASQRPANQSIAPCASPPASSSTNEPTRP